MTPERPEPFPPPKLLTARRILGTVISEPSSVPDDAVVAPALERSRSLAGNILVVESDDGTQKYYLLQRKLKTTRHGSLRLGYELEKNENSWGFINTGESIQTADLKKSGDNSVPFEGESFEMVTVKVESSQQSDSDQLKARLAALQWITNQGSKEDSILGPLILAKDEGSHAIYTISPYVEGGSLFDYCARVGTLPEDEGKLIFLGILECLKKLRDIGVSHRGLTLGRVLLRTPSGSKCTLSHWDAAVKIPRQDGVLVEPQPLIGVVDPQFVAPELLQQVPFDGYAVDLWSTGIILLLMLDGKNDLLFDAPVKDDARFQELCIGKDGLRRLGGSSQTKLSPSVVDLLQRMLRANPKDRLSLEQVKEHPWVVGK